MTADISRLVLQSAPQELIDLACKVRGWDPTDLAAAMLAAEQASWDFERIFRYVIQLIEQPDGAPDGLRYAARNPLRPDRRPLSEPDQEAIAYSKAQAAKTRELCGFEQPADGSPQ